MFAPSPALAALVDALYEVVSLMDRGDVLTHEAAALVIGHAPHEGPYDHVVRRVRRRLLRRRHIACWPETTVGYRLLTLEEQLQSMLWYQRKAYRAQGRARRNGSSLPDRQLGPDQRRLKALLLDRLRRSRADMARSCRESLSIVRPTPTAPLRPVRLRTPAAWGECETAGAGG